MMITDEQKRKPLTLQSVRWCGLKIHKGALIYEGLEGEVQYYDKKFHYCKNNTAIKTLETVGDLLDLVMPIANAKIQERRKARNNNDKL